AVRELDDRTAQRALVENQRVSACARHPYDQPATPCDIHDVLGLDLDRARNVARKTLECRFRIQSRCIGQFAIDRERDTRQRRIETEAACDPDEVLFVTCASEYQFTQLAPHLATPARVLKLLVEEYALDEPRHEIRVLQQVGRHDE